MVGQLSYYQSYFPWCHWSPLISGTTSHRHDDTGRPHSCILMTAEWSMGTTDMEFFHSNPYRTKTNKHRVSMYRFFLYKTVFNKTKERFGSNMIGSSSQVIRHRRRMDFLMHHEYQCTIIWFRSSYGYSSSFGAGIGIIKSNCSNCSMLDHKIVLLLSNITSLFIQLLPFQLCFFLVQSELICL